MAYQPSWVIYYQAIFVEEQWWYYLTHTWGGGDKEVHASPKGSSPNVNLSAILEFELTYHDVAVQHISNYATRIPPYHSG